MKSGTTSLCRDLALHPRIGFPAGKEPEGLAFDDVLAGAGREAYLAPFRRAREGMVCGDASMRYTFRPHFEGCAGRAREVLGDDPRIVYLVREPVARALSHHYHDYAHGTCGPDVDAEMRRLPFFIDASRYAFQIEPWIETFGRERVLIARFEDYVADRRRVTAEVSRFIGVEPKVEARGWSSRGAPSTAG
jgi:hypothetical protein